MEWVSLTQAAALEAMPTAVAASGNMRTAYETWIAADPSKSGRLSEIRLNAVARVRDAILSNRANTVLEDVEAIPRSTVQSALDLIWHALAMEMGLDISTAGSQAMIRADLFVRQIAYGHFVVEDEDSMPSPSMQIPAVSATRALPVIISLMLMFCNSTWAGWIKPGATIDDTSVLTTFSPTAYTNTTSTLFGHLWGINGSIATFRSQILTLQTNTAPITSAIAMEAATRLSVDQSLQESLDAVSATANGAINTANTAYGEALAATLAAGRALSNNTASGWSGAAATTDVQLASKSLASVQSVKFASGSLTASPISNTISVNSYGLIFNDSYAIPRTIHHSGTFTPGMYQTITGFNVWGTNRLQWVGASPTTRNDAGVMGQVRGEGTNLFIRTATIWARILLDVEALPE